MPEPALAAELAEMGRQDQAQRDEMARHPLDPAFVAEWQREDLRRERRLATIVDTRGWPAISMVGYEAATAAWLIVQHGTPAFLKHCVPLMQAAAARLEIEPQHLALSIDRDLVNDGKPQRYGSQAQTNADGTTFFLPIEDPEHVDARRFAMGLEPLASYRARMLVK